MEGESQAPFVDSGPTKRSPVIGCCNLVINAVLAYFFWQYWQNNPDEGSCFANPTSYAPSAVKVDWRYTDVSGQWGQWFMWGLFLNIASIILACVQLAPADRGHPCFALSMCCITCPVVCGGLAWFITGLVLRYNEIGYICSGDYLRTQIAINPSIGTVGETPYAW